MMKFSKTIAITLVCCTSSQTFALEGGKSIYSHGAENYMAGAAPPPGFHGLLYGTYYSANRLNDNNGNKVDVPNFKVKASAIVPRFTWVSESKTLGGNVILDIVLPLVNLETQIGSEAFRDQGIGDIMIGPALAYHHTTNLHSGIALDLYLPTGNYDKSEIANIGTNRMAIEPVYAITYMNQDINADLRIGYLFNGKNDDTQYKSGDELHFDYALGLNYNTWTYGISGYYQKQMQNDSINGNPINNSKAEGFSIGPSIKYQNNDWFVTLKYEKEVMTKNKTEGDAVWLKTVLPF